jgi:hypothetical protein
VNSPPDQQWETLKSLFRETSQKNSRRSHLLEQKAKGYVLDEMRTFPRISRGQILHELQSLHVFDNVDMIAHNTDENLRLPCHSIPTSKNPRFFPRPEIMQIIRSNVDHNAGQSRFRSFTLSGNPGIGKTQMALEYAYERYEQGVKAVFWINAETALDIAQGFTLIAIELGLEGAKANEGNDQNKIIVMSWLQRTCE